jgi:hypothetical protein
MHILLLEDNLRDRELLEKTLIFYQNHFHWRAYGNRADRVWTRHVKLVEIFWGGIAGARD